MFRDRLARRLFGYPTRCRPHNEEAHGQPNFLCTRLPATPSSSSDAIDTSCAVHCCTRSAVQTPKLRARGRLHSPSFAVATFACSSRLTQSCAFRSTGAYLHFESLRRAHSTAFQLQARASVIICTPARELTTFSARASHYLPPPRRPPSPSTQARHRPHHRRITADCC